MYKCWNTQVLLRAASCPCIFKDNVYFSVFLFPKQQMHSCWVFCMQKMESSRSTFPHADFYWPSPLSHPALSLLHGASRDSRYPLRGGPFCLWPSQGLLALLLKWLLFYWSWFRYSHFSVVSREKVKRVVNLLLDPGVSFLNFKLCVQKEKNYVKIH